MEYILKIFMRLSLVSTHAHTHTHMHTQSCTGSHSRHVGSSIFFAPFRVFIVEALGI